MKTLSILFLITLFASCSKIDLSLGDGWSNFGGFIWSGDSSNKVKADITADGAISHFSATAFSTSFSRYVLAPYSDSSFVTINANDTSINLRIELVNILTPGTYTFGHNTGSSKEVKASCSIRGINYLNNPNVLSGTIRLDTLTTKRIHGSFNVKCWNGTDFLNITTGSLEGNLL